MQFAFRNEIEGSMVKSMLGRHGISRRLLTKVKFDGGQIMVNGIEKTAIYRLEKGDLVTITVPDEPDNEKLIPDDVPLNVLFEDDHYLVVEKPAGKASITGSLHPTG
ncbi:MAG: RluA family pseudouridine synthase, partial [Lactococcus cremoris]